MRKVINKAAELYGLDTAEVSVTLTNNDHIREINRNYRNKDAATDVISFALNEGEEPEIIDGPDVNMLGDIIISIERAMDQAEEYGHSLERELAFLTVHGMMHLLGYDHIEEEDRREMRKEEEYVLGHLGIIRA
ncbi:MAG: metalloprotease ybeY [Massilibacillus sp.]|nr:metalloprotease ybeY [Massilibacillus sp.]